MSPRSSIRIASHATNVPTQPEASPLGHSNWLAQVHQGPRAIEYDHGSGAEVVAPLVLRASDSQ